MITEHAEMGRGRTAASRAAILSEARTHLIAKIAGLEARGRKLSSIQDPTRQRLEAAELDMLRSDLRLEAEAIGRSIDRHNARCPECRVAG